MNGVLSSTNVRKEFGKFIDTVIHERPTVVKRNRDQFLALSIVQTKVLLESFNFEAHFMKEEDGSVTATLDKFDLVVNKPDEYLAHKALAEELIEYADEYFSEFPLYFNSTNRKSHFPYVLLVGIQENLDDVMRLIRA